MSVSTYKYEQQVWNLQRELIHILLKTKNLSLLQKVKSDLEKSEKISDAEGIVGSRPDGTLVTLEDLRLSIKQSEEEYERGETISMEDLEKESENWFK